MSLNIEQSKDGYKILQVEIDGKKQYIGSKYNHAREIENFISSFEQFTDKDNYIVFGLSFGEHIEKLLQLTQSESKILIIEINEELINYCKEDEHISKIINNPRITIAQTEEDVKKFFREYITQMNVNNTQLGYYCKYDRAYGERLADIYKIIKSESERIMADRNTSIFFGEDWFESLLANLKYMAQGTPANDFYETYKNKPAIIVSAGPSLSKNIGKLKGVKNALIISGGRTLKPLLEENIEPTCLCVIDPGEVSYKLVDGAIENVKCPLVFYDGTNPKVVKEHKGDKIFSTNNKFITNIWKEDIITLSGGGSVAHVMAIFAAYMGCNPIIFIGQDLAYTGEKGHADIAKNKWQNMTFDNYKKDNDIYVDDINGNKVRTSLTLNGYRLALEEIIEGFKDTKFINATEGGANIKGAENKTLEEALAELDKEPIVSMKKFLRNENRKKDIINKLEKTLEIFKECILLCNKGRRILGDFKTNYYLKNQNKLSYNIEQLDKIDNKIREGIASITLIDTILFNTMFDIENKPEFIITSSDNKEEIFNKNINKNEAIYFGLKSVIEKCYEKVEKTIMEMKEE